MSITSEVKYLGALRTSATHLKSGTIIETDAPTDNNGKGALFSPTDLAATSLASCLLTVMGIKAEQKGIAFERLQCSVTKVMTSGPRRISEIKVTVEVDEDWSEKERKLLEHTARTCPVSLSLHPDISQDISFIYLRDV
jgi:uncharacterized OsmC-like protein